VTETRKYSKKDDNMSRDQLSEAPIAQIWDNLYLKKIRLVDYSLLNKKV
jgi:hypothetical protein